MIVSQIVKLEQVSIQKTKKIYIPIFSDSVRSKTFSLNRGNPGAGGTQFTSIRFALALAAERPDWQVVLVNNTKIQLEHAPLGIEQEIFQDPSEFFNDFTCDRSGVIVATAAILKRIDLAILKRIEGHILCWSRHPFDLSIRKLTKQVKFKGIVCVGTYQFYSNRNVKANVHHIQNIFILPTLDNRNDDFKLDSQSLQIVYLGALIPAKGFLEVAKSWQALKTRFPGVTLHVIGSAATHGLRFDSELIPASTEFAAGILHFIPKSDIEGGNVIFHGNLGEEKFDIIRKCDLAILNPKGYTEAFPASPLECMACGTPVIASDDYGMSDAMRFFPELVINGHKNILKKVEWVVEDPLRYRELQQRSLSVARWFSLQTDLIITRWIRLLESVSRSDVNHQDMILPPTMPFYGSRIQLFVRQYIRGKLNVVRQYFTKRQAS